jgi:hypothetical protein
MISPSGRCNRWAVPTALMRCGCSLPGVALFAFAHASPRGTRWCVPTALVKPTEVGSRKDVPSALSFSWQT